MASPRTAAARKIQRIFRAKRAFPNNSGITRKASPPNRAKIIANLERDFKAQKAKPYVPQINEMRSLLAGKPVYHERNPLNYFLNIVTERNIQNAMIKATGTPKSAGIRFSKTKLISFLATINKGVDIHKVLTGSAPVGGYGFQQITGYTSLKSKPQVQYFQGKWEGNTAGIKYIFAKRASGTLRLSRDGIMIFGNDKTRVKLLVQRCILNGWIPNAQVSAEFKHLNGTFKMNKKINLDMLNRFIYNSPLIEGKPSMRSGGKQVIRTSPVASSPSSASASPKQNVENMLNQAYRMMHPNSQNRSPNDEGEYDFMHTNSPYGSANEGENYRPGYNYQGEEMGPGASNWHIRKRFRRTAEYKLAKAEYEAAKKKPTTGNLQITINLNRPYQNQGKIVEQARKRRKAREVKTLKSLVFTMKDPKFTFIVFENGTVNFAGLKVEDLELPKKIFSTFFAVAGSANTVFGSPVSRKGKTNAERLAERYRLVLQGNWSRVNSARVPQGYYVRPGANGKPRLYPYIKFLEGGVPNKMMDLKAVAPKVRKAFENAKKPIPRVTLNVFRNAGYPLNAPANNNKKVYVKKNISNRRASNWSATKPGHYILPGPGKQPVFKEIPKILNKAKGTVIEKYKKAGVNIPKSVRNLFRIPANVVTAGNKTHVLTRENKELKINGKQAKRFKEAELLAIARNLKIAGATNTTSKKVLLELLNKHQARKPSPARQANINNIEWENVV
jgi:hypothetical protein